MNFLDLHDDVIGMLLSPQYVDHVDCTMLSYVCQNLRERLVGRTTHESLCDRAASRGYLEVLKWADATGYPIHMWTISCSISIGNLAVSKWLYKKGSNALDFGSYYAIAGGHLDIVEWMHKKGYKYHDCAIVVREGYFDILKFLIEIGCKPNSEMYREAIRLNRLDMMDLMLKNENTLKLNIIYDDPCLDAIKHGHFEMLKLLHSYGYIPKHLSFVSAITIGRQDILKWLYENGSYYQNSTGANVSVYSAKPVNSNAFTR